MREFTVELEKSIFAAYRLAVDGEKLDVAEHLLLALQELAKECPEIDKTVDEALLMIRPRPRSN